MKKLILTVCKGNIHRSVIAALCIENALKKLGLGSEYEIISRGLQGSAGTDMPRFPNIMSYPNEWSLTKPTLEEIGIEIPLSQKATPITEDIISRASLILAMDQSVLYTSPNSLIKQFPNFGFKMRLFQELTGKADDITDCEGRKDVETFRNIALAINSVAQNHIAYLIELAKIFST